MENLNFGDGSVQGNAIVGQAEEENQGTYVAHSNVVQKKKEGGGEEEEEEEEEFLFSPVVACCIAQKGRVGKYGLSGSPMNQHASSAMEALLDESVAGGEMLNDVLVIHIIDLDDVAVVEIQKEVVIEGQPQDGYYMRDVGLIQSFFAPQGE